MIGAFLTFFNDDVDILYGLDVVYLYEGKLVFTVSYLDDGATCG